MEGKGTLHKNLIKSMFNVLILFITMMVIFIKSFSWITLQNEGNVRGINGELYDEDIQVEYSVYMWNFDTETGSNIDKNGKAIHVSNINMHAYDLIFTALNRFTPVVIRVAIKGSDMPFEGSAVIEIERDTSKGVYSIIPPYTNDLSEYTSSIIRLTAAKGANYFVSNPDGTPNVAAIYHNVIYGDSNIGIIPIKGNEASFNTKTFTQAIPNGNSFSYTKVDELKFVVPYTQDDWNDTDGDGINETLNIYVLMDYDTIQASENVPSLVDIYCLGHGISLGEISLDNKVYLSNDLVRIRADRFKENN